MSIVALKRKTATKQGKLSGKRTDVIWLSDRDAKGESGFSLEGTLRLKPTNRDQKNSSIRTPFKGAHPVGHGGKYGQYKETAIDIMCKTRGTEYEYAKHSVLSYKGMMAKRLECQKQYPNYWVQPNYTGNQTQTASQQLYIEKKGASNTCTLGVNDVNLYKGYCKPCTNSNGASYTKTIYQPVSYREYLQKRTQGCTNPQGATKPFPFAVRGATSMAATGGHITAFASGCGTQDVYLSPPDWYLYEKPKRPVEETTDTVPFDA